MIVKETFINPPKLTWDEVLQDTDTIGAEVDLVQLGVTRGGTLTKLERVGRSIVLTCSSWSITVDEDVILRYIGMGRILLMFSNKGYCVIYSRTQGRVETANEIELQE